MSIHGPSQNALQPPIWSIDMSVLAWTMLVVWTGTGPCLRNVAVMAFQEIQA